MRRPVSDVTKLDHLIGGWPAPELTALGVTTPERTLGTAGDTSRVSRVASISKICAALAALVAIEEGTISLDDEAGPAGSTVRHLLAHAAGYAFDGDEPITDVETRRIYSNTGIEVFAEHLAQAAGMPFADYQREAVFEQLGMNNTELVGSPAYGVHSNVDDLLLLTRELMRPTIVAAASMAAATNPHYPDLKGVVPGLGRFDPNPWGLAIEIRGEKHPHWTAPSHSPRTFGHFGGTGTYLWVDPERSLGAVAISGVEFGPWALDVWPTTNQAILDTFA